MEGLLSRLAREAGFAAYPGSIPASAVAGSVGLLAWRTSAARPSRPGFRAVARAEDSPPYSRAAATVSHRLPGTECKSRTDFQSVDFHKNLAEMS